MRASTLACVLACAASALVVACDVADTSGNAEASGQARSALCDGEDSYIDENGEEVICVYTEEPYEPPDFPPEEPEDPPMDPCFLYPDFCNPEPTDPCEINPDACNPGGGGGEEPPPEELGKCVYYQQLSYTGFADSYTPGHEAMVATGDAALKDAKDQCVVKESDATCQRACLSLTKEHQSCQWIDTVWPFWDYWHCIVLTDLITKH